MKQLGHAEEVNGSWSSMTGYRVGYSRIAKLKEYWTSSMIDFTTRFATTVPIPGGKKPSPKQQLGKL